MATPPSSFVQHVIQIVSRAQALLPTNAQVVKQQEKLSTTPPLHPALLPVQTTVQRKHMKTQEFAMIVTQVAKLVMELSTIIVLLVPQVIISLELPTELVFLIALHKGQRIFTTIM